MNLLEGNRPSSGVISLKELGLHMWPCNVSNFGDSELSHVFPTVQDFLYGHFAFGTAGGWQYAAIPGEPCAGELQGMCRWQIER